MNAVSMEVARTTRMRSACTTDVGDVGRRQGARDRGTDATPDVAHLTVAVHAFPELVRFGGGGVRVNDVLPGGGQRGVQ